MKTGGRVAIVQPMDGRLRDGVYASKAAGRYPAWCALKWQLRQAYAAKRQARNAAVFDSHIIMKSWLLRGFAAVCTIVGLIGGIVSASGS
jgi:hypothetical protein